MSFPGESLPRDPILLTQTQSKVTSKHSTEVAAQDVFHEEKASTQKRLQNLLGDRDHAW
jgi:hypothetical protein